MFSITAFGLASAALMASAAQFNISVGFNDQLVYNPSSISNAVPGDVVNFMFLNKNHSATQSTFAAPCTPMAGGIDSGFQFINASEATTPVWSVAINATDPLWFYCAQTNPVSHCTSGMVFAVNAPANKTFAQFQSAAEALGGGSSASGSGTGVIPAPSSLPTGSGASGTDGTGATGSGAVAPSSAGTDNPSGTGAASPSSSGAAVALNPTGALSVASFVAAIAGFML